MSWTDEDIDGLFRDAAAQKEFRYDATFFEEIERQLPIHRRRKSRLYWVLSYSMLVLFSLVNLKTWKTESVVVTEDKRLNAKSISSWRSNNKIESSLPSPALNHSKSATIQSAVIQNSAPFIPNLLEDAIVDIPLRNEVFSLNDDSEQPEIKMKTNPLLASFGAGEIITSNISLEEEISKNNYYLQFNGGVGQGYNTVINRSHTNGIVSMELGVKRSVRNFTLNIGANFQWTKMDDLKIKERTKIYGFGYSTYDNVYSFNGMATCGLSTGVSRKFKRHEVGIVASPSLRMFALLDRMQLLDGQQFLSSSGVSDVSMFRKISLPTGLQYFYAINESIQIGLNASYDLVQPISSNRFEGSPIKNPFQIQFGIRTNLGR
jgi:hypothetical protein